MAVAVAVAVAMTQAVPSCRLHSVHLLRGRQLVASERWQVGIVSISTLTALSTRARARLFVHLSIISAMCRCADVPMCVFLHVIVPACLSVCRCQCMPGYVCMCASVCGGLCARIRVRVCLSGWLAVRAHVLFIGMCMSVFLFV